MIISDAHDDREAPSGEPDSAGTEDLPSPPSAPPFGLPIRYEEARRIAEAAKIAAGAINVPSSIAVVEPSGDLVFFLKMDGAPYSSIQLAQQKAITSARYRRPTAAFYEGIENGHTFFLTFPGITAAPGGMLIVADGKLIGALGISGGNGDQDVLIGNAGLLALRNGAE